MSIDGLVQNLQGQLEEAFGSITAGQNSGLTRKELNPFGSNTTLGALFKELGVTSQAELNAETNLRTEKGNFMVPAAGLPAANTAPPSGKILIPNPVEPSATNSIPNPNFPLERGDFKTKSGNRGKGFTSDLDAPVTVGEIKPTINTNSGKKDSNATTPSTPLNSPENAGIVSKNAPTFFIPVPNGQPTAENSPVPGTPNVPTGNNDALPVPTTGNAPTTPPSAPNAPKSDPPPAAPFDPRSANVPKGPSDTIDAPLPGPVSTTLRPISPKTQNNSVKKAATSAAGVAPTEVPKNTWATDSWQLWTLIGGLLLLVIGIIVGTVVFLKKRADKLQRNDEDLSGDFNAENPESV